MKKYIFISHQAIVGLLLMSIIVSCKKLIEIPANPPTEIAESQQFSDSTTTMTAVVGVYSYAAFTGSGFGYNDGLQVEATALSADELLSTATTDPLLAQFYNYGLLATNGYTEQLWNAPYTNLYSVNAIISGVANSKNLSTSFRNQVTGEMEVLRSFYYFNLVNLFGGVPLVTTTDYKVNATLPRSGVDSVYSRIINDLTNAQHLLKAGYPAGDRYRPNLYVADALLARVYLYKQQWQKAYDAATMVITSGVYNLENDPDNVFLDGSSEAIWQIPATGPYVVTVDAQNFVPYSKSVVPNFPISVALLNAFETGDTRKDKWLGMNVVGSQSYYYPYKYKNKQPSAPTREDYMLIRLSELYLIRAEAEQHLGRNSDALNDINIVRARAGLAGSTANAASDVAVTSAIMHERQVELFCEWGHRWYDLKRTGTATQVLTSEKSNFQSYQQLYPVPQAELRLNIKLQQNPNY